MGDSLAGEVLVARRVDVGAGRVLAERGGIGVGAGRVSVGRERIAVKVAVGRGSGVGLIYPLVGVGSGEGNGESAWTRYPLNMMTNNTIRQSHCRVVVHFRLTTSFAPPLFVPSLYAICRPRQCAKEDIQWLI